MTEEVGLIQQLWAMSPEIIAAVTSIVTVASVVIAGTKTPDPNSALGKVYKLLEWAALNVGKAKGVSIGNAVINNWGMIGRVIEVGKRSSRVLLITDINSQIPIYFEKSKHKAILIGKNSDLLELKYLKPRVNISNNERIITSGEGGLLPRGLAVGLYIKNLNEEENKIKILPTRNWDSFDNVNVIIYNNKTLY